MRWNGNFGIDILHRVAYTMATSKSQTKQYAAISKYNCFFLIVPVCKSKTSFLVMEYISSIIAVSARDSFPTRRSSDLRFHFDEHFQCKRFLLCITDVYLGAFRDKNSTYALKNTENSTIIKGENDWTQTMRKSNGILHFYKADTETVDFIPAAELTITFVCYHYPRTMLQKLQRDRQITVEKRSCVRTGRN